MKKSIIVLLFAGLAFASPVFAVNSSAVTNNLSEVTDQINKISQDLNTKKQQKQQIDAALRDSQSAINKTKSLLQSLQRKRDADLAQLNQLSNTIPQMESSVAQAKSIVGNSMTTIYQQLKQIEGEQDSILSGNDSIDANRKKAYLIEILTLQQQQYQKLSQKLTELQNLNNRLVVEVDRLNAKLGNTAKQHDKLLTVTSQKSQEAAQVQSQIASEQTKLSNLKQKQAQLNSLLAQLAAAERKQKAQQLAAKKAAAKAAQLAKSKPTMIVARQAGTAPTSTNNQTNNVAAVSSVSKPSSSSSQVAIGNPDGSVEDNSPFMSRKLTKPVAGNISVGFGQMRDSVRNNGVLISAADNTPIYSVSRGNVLFSGNLPGFGQIVVIDNGDNYTSVYSGIIAKVSKGSTVNAGQAIGSSGSSSNQPMGGVYFELRHLGKPVNPMRLF